jgi:hypothetical protein
MNTAANSGHCCTTLIFREIFKVGTLRMLL